MTPGSTTVDLLAEGGGQGGHGADRDRGPLAGLEERLERDQREQGEARALNDHPLRDPQHGLAVQRMEPEEESREPPGRRTAEARELVHEEGEQHGVQRVEADVADAEPGRVDSEHVRSNHANTIGSGR